ncbi:MAG TPA: hypothetical protein VJR26_12220 [Candidatus Acidoferrales bacterium]|nr:hypothetical protein [Candidatus Acidoferrales bacterium]
MRRSALLLSAVFLFGFGTLAQENSQNPSLVETGAEAGSPSGSVAHSMPLPAWIVTPPIDASTSSMLPGVTGLSSSSKDVPVADPQVTIGVRETYPFQLYVGYTFLRFYELPSKTLSTNGFNYSIVYYPLDWIGADGEFVLTLGDQYPYQARFLLGMGGARVRARPFRRDIEVWAHALAGRSHFVPQTPFGGQGAFAYELGGGVDLNTLNGRYAIRAGADMVGTRYFGTEQFSPKISVGFVYKF